LSSGINFLYLINRCCELPESVKPDVLLKPQDSGQDFLSIFAQVFNQNSKFRFGLLESGNPDVYVKSQKSKFRFGLPESDNPVVLLKPQGQVWTS
jgi:hypothetical protein